MTYFNYFTNPFNLNKGRISKTLPKNQTIWKIVNTQKIDLSRPVVCFVNGIAKLRKDWANPLSSQDVVSFVVLPLGGGGGSSNPLKTVLTWYDIFRLYTKPDIFLTSSRK